MSEIEAKVRYVKLARSLKTYGVSFFLVKVEQESPAPLLLLLGQVFLFSISSSFPSPPTTYLSAHTALALPVSLLSAYPSSNRRINEVGEDHQGHLIQPPSRPHRAY